MTKQRQRKVTQDTLRILTLWWQEHIIIEWLYSTLVGNIFSKNISPTLFTNCTFSFVLVFAYSCLLCLYFIFNSLTSSLPCSGKLLRIRLLALMLLSPRGFGDIFSSPFGLFQVLMPYSLSDLFNYWTLFGIVLFLKYPHLLQSFLTFLFLKNNFSPNFHWTFLFLTSLSRT